MASSKCFTLLQLKFLLEINTPPPPEQQNQVYSLYNFQGQWYTRGTEYDSHNILPFSHPSLKYSLLIYRYLLIVTERDNRIKYL